MPAAPVPTLLLFDIDGTLLAGATAVHAAALHEALRRVHGIEPEGVRTTLAPAGRTDGEIARAILLAAGIRARQIDERAARVRSECCRLYADLLQEDLAHTLLPGVRPLLEELSGRPDVALSLLTGNYETVARAKLAAAGIADHFPPGQGAFGSDAEDRLALVAIARRRAGRGGPPHPRERTIVIGDTPRDILCARADGVRCIAVASGPFDVRQLRDADAVAADALQLRELLCERPLPGHVGYPRTSFL